MQMHLDQSCACGHVQMLEELSHAVVVAALVVVDAPFQTKSGVQIGVQAMTSCVAINIRVTMIYASPEKQNISALLEIM